MNKIRSYWKNKKGITLVWGAIFLVFLLMCAGMAIDLAYMYHVRNQLHVAADAAALAGVTKLDGTSATTQTLARQEAWKFACKNNAAGTPVYLASNASSDCNTPPGSGLNDANNPSGDIVVGNWNFSRPRGTQSCDDQRFLPTILCDGTSLPLSGAINAVKAVPRRTGETTGMPRVSVFFGQIFRILGPGEGWSFMNVAAQAIATMPLKASSFVAVGDEFCPLPGNPECTPPTGSIHPNICYLVTPRELLAQEFADDEVKMGWTSLLFRPGSTSEFTDLMCGTSPYQDVCPPIPGIWGIPGVSERTFKNYSSLMCDPTFDASSKEIDASGNVTGWEVVIPVVARTDPMSAPDPNPVWGYAKIHIIEICSPGSPGCRGAGSCLSYGYCGGGDKKIVIDRIACIQCGTDAPGLKPALVK